MSAEAVPDDGAFGGIDRLELAALDDAAAALSLAAAAVLDDRAVLVVTVMAIAVAGALLADAVAGAVAALLGVVLLIA